MRGPDEHGAAVGLDPPDIQRTERYRQRKKTAVLAIMFTDIAGSTSLRERLGEVAYEQLREEHDDKLRAIIEADDVGAVIKGTGDGLLAVFAEPSAAVERALQIQKTLLGHAHFRVRIGLDMGQVSQVRAGGIVTDVFGRQVDRAARVQADAQPEHILASFQVYDCAVGWLRPDRVAWHNHGSVHLRGVSAPISLHEPYDPAAATPQRAPASAEFSEFGNLLASRFVPNRPPRVNISYNVELPPPIPPLTATPAADPVRHYLLEIETAARNLDRPLAILWVDDYPQNNGRVVRCLRNATCQVVQALSTEEAVAQFKQGPFDVIITDMGRGDNPHAGLDLLQRPRDKGLLTPTIVFASRNAICNYGEKARQLGAVLCTSGEVTLIYGVAELCKRLS